MSARRQTKMSIKCVKNKQPDRDVEVTRSVLKQLRKNEHKEGSNIDFI
jgi:hypothetical protein